MWCKLPTSVLVDTFFKKISSGPLNLLKRKFIIKGPSRFLKILDLFPPLNIVKWFLSNIILEFNMLNQLFDF